MPVELVPIPFNSGQREDLDAKLLPDGLFAVVTNGRLYKTGELGVRLSYTALSMSVMGGGTLRAFDVVSHGERLLAMGTTDANADGPEKLFAYNFTANQWVGESTGTGRRSISAVTELRQVFRPPYVVTDEAQLYDLAYAGSHLALVYENAAGGTEVSIFAPATGAIIFAVTVASRTHPRVVGVGSTFVFAWQDSSDDVRACTFVVGSSTALGAETVLHNTGTVGDGIDLCAVSGASEFVLLVVRSDTNVCTIRRCTLALAVSATGTLTDTDINLASVVSVSGGRTTVAYRDTSSNYLVESFTTSTLASAVAPVALFGGSTGARPPAIVRKNSTQLIISAAIPDTIDHQLKVDLRTETTLALVGSTLTHRELSQQSKPVVSSDELFVGVVSPHGEGGLTSFAGILDLEAPRGWECAHNRGFAVDALSTWLGATATDGTYHWAVFPVTDLNCSNAPVVMQFRLCSPERRQTAALGGLLYIAGGFVSVWDGGQTVEAGFFETPQVVSGTPSPGGAMTVSSTYRYTEAWDWRDLQNNRHLSPVSDDFEVITGVGDQEVDLVLSSPHTRRSATRSIGYRTRPAPDRTPRRSVFGFPAGTGATLALLDQASDTEILTQEIVYTQGTRGNLSGPLQHEAPFPSEFLWPGRDRITNGGLPNRSQAQRSKSFFPEEPIEWSSQPGHFINIDGFMTAVFALDDFEYIATREAIWVVGGVGPNDLGEGEFAKPRLLPGNDVGVTDWRSVACTAEGVWFRAAPDRLMSLARGGSAAEWLSQAVRDTLKAFPVTTAAAIGTIENTVSWAVQNAAGNAGRIVSYDTRAGVWYVDTLEDLANGPVAAMCEHVGRLVCVVNGAVYRQDLTYPGTIFLPLTVRTGAMHISQYFDGWGRLKGFSTGGKMKGVHRVEGFVSFADGKAGTFVSCVAAPVDVVLADYDVDETVELPWYPKRRKGNRVVLEIRITADGISTPSQAQTLNHLQLEVIRQRKASRKGPRP